MNCNWHVMSKNFKKCFFALTRFFCPEGQTTSTPSAYPCLAGHYCAGGNAVSVPCHNDTYQNATGQSSCLPCPPGHYCDPSEGFVISPKQCPQGSYCPDGKRIKCAIGMLRDFDGSLCDLN